MVHLIRTASTVLYRPCHYLLTPNLRDELSVPQVADAVGSNLSTSPFRFPLHHLYCFLIELDRDKPAVDRLDTEYIQYPRENPLGYPPLSASRPRLTGSRCRSPA